MLLKHGVTDSVANIEWSTQLSEIAAAAGGDDARLAIEAIAKAVKGLRSNGMSRVVLEVMMLETPAVSSEIVEAINLGDDSDDESGGGWDEPTS